MILASLAVVIGLIILVWSADWFIEGAALTAGHFGMPPLLIGMVIVGFGTSAPEMLVAGLAAVQGNPGLALGNAYGSNITNIGLILGLTALMSPFAVESSVLRKELPLLIAVTALTAVLLLDDSISRADAWILIAVFILLMSWTVYTGIRTQQDPLAEKVEYELQVRTQPLWRSLTALAAGLALLIISSRILVWGAVEIARQFGVSDLIIGLTIVAAGTSLPELASSIAAVRKGEHSIALGNIIGSNLFNTLAVVGLAGAIQPMIVGPEVFNRDILVMSVMTLSLFAFGYGFRRPGRINRGEGLLLLLAYVAYTGYLVSRIGAV